ncbi:MAG: hypothetical protein P8008_06040 [Gammaproteobacteria bacterium]
MKRSIITIALAVLGAALAGGCVVTATDSSGKPDSTPSEPKSVKFKFEVSGGALVPKNGKTPGCGSFPEPFQDGCFVAGVNERQAIDVQLDKSNGWWFHKLQICGVETPAKPDFNNCGLIPARASDFKIVVGKTYLVPGSDGTVLLDSSSRDRKFTIWNENWLPGLYFYRIEACTQDGKEEVTCVETDPGGINRGIGM